MANRLHHPGPVWVSLGLLLVGLLGAYLLGPAASSRTATIPAPQPRPAPSVKGERVEVARQLLTLAGLGSESGVFYVAPDKWRDDLREGVVYMQAPQPEQPAAPGTPVALWTFRKAEKDQRVVKTPDVRGKTRREAGQALGAAGLVPTKPPEGEPATGDETAVAGDQYPHPDQPVFAKTAVFVRYRPK